MKLSRRKFVQTTATSLLATNALLSRATASSLPGSKKVKVALVGCGGRSRRDAPFFVKACKLLGLEAEFVVLADAFKDMAYHRADVQGVDRSKCVWGWDAYKKAAESDAEFVMLVTPPVFRPLHFEAMVEAGKHVLLQKPVAVDAPGCRRIIATGKKALKKGLAVVAGTQRRHDINFRTNKAKVDAGAIGEIVSGVISWHGVVPWIKDRKPEWSDADYLARNWVNWTEMSGDHIVEQHVHTIDVANWFIGRTPVSAIGYGGRARRETGNSYDNFSLDLDYGNGVRINSLCRQISGTYQRVSEYFRGTEGEVYAGGKIKGKEVAIPKIETLDSDGSTQGMVEWIQNARNGVPMNESDFIAESTATGIMGRYAAYTGDFVRYRDLMENQNSKYYDMKVAVQGEDFENGTVMMPEEDVIALPGDGVEIPRR